MELTIGGQSTAHRNVRATSHNWISHVWSESSVFQWLASNSRCLPVFVACSLLGFEIVLNVNEQAGLPGTLP